MKKFMGIVAILFLSAGLLTSCNSNSSDISPNINKEGNRMNGNRTGSGGFNRDRTGTGSRPFQNGTGSFTWSRGGRTGTGMRQFWSGSNSDAPAWLLPVIAAPSNPPTE